MKVAGCRAALYPLRTELITLFSAYSDTAAMTSFSRRSQYVNSLSLVTANAARTTLGIKREVEQIRSNAFYSTF